VERGGHHGAAVERVVGIVGWFQPTNAALATAWRALGIEATLLEPERARAWLGPGDVAVGRLDVLETLDGVEPGIEVLDELAGRGVRVLNGVTALLDAHDKLRSTACLVRAGLPHPATVHVSGSNPVVPLEPPLVVKPRHGSWGVDVFRCESRDALAHTLRAVRDRPWFEQHGALVQQLVPPLGYDLRLLVAGGEVVGATERVAAPGEWRTNVSLGGTRRPTRPSASARALGVRAAKAVGADLVGIDLLPTSDGYVVLELNGAVEFDHAYDLDDTDVYAAAAAGLALPRPDGTMVTADRVAGRSPSPR
jgi:RimK family alpha-L-glutamate ligase